MEIKNVVVIGSGTMGSGIAAQLCNANIPVTLLDLKTEISQKAKEKIKNSFFCTFGNFSFKIKQSNRYIHIR